MTPPQEMIMAFLSKNVIDSAKGQFGSGIQKINIKMYDITFHLFRCADNVIAFEFPMNYAGEKGEDIDIPGVGSGYIRKDYRFYNPIGFFSLRNGKVEAFILNLFMNEYNLLKSNNMIKIDIPLNTLDLLSNAIIGAFSAEAMIHVQRHQNCKFVANGLDYYVSLANDG